jgi:hypothetical protein
MFHPAMNTLIDAAKPRLSNAKPSNPVDAALWGLAERLATTIDAGEPKVVSLAESRLPKRSLGLPRASRLADQFAAKPKKPAKAVKAPPVAESPVVDPIPEVAPPGRVEFTILKSRRENVGSASADGQHRSAVGETQTAAKPSRHGKPRRKRAGITLLGWSLLVAGAAVAAAIALWAPAWL